MPRRTLPPCWPEPAAFQLDPSGHVLQINPAAQALLQAQADLFALNQGRLQITGLATALPCASAAGCVVLALPRAGRLPVTLRVVSGAGGHRVLQVLDPESLQPDPELLRRLFQLTPSEARVTAALAQGQRTEAIAQALQVQVNTVQAHLKRALAKTGLQRQTQLVSLVLCSVAMWPVTA